MVVALFLIVLVGSFGLSLAMSKRLQSSELDRIRDRLVGKAKLRKGTKGAASGQALMQSDDAGKGKLALRLLDRLRLADRLNSLLEQGGLRWNVARFLHAALALALGVFSMTWYAFPPPFHRAAFLTGPLAGAFPFLYVKRKAASRMRKFEEQFPDSLEFVSRSMRAGHAFSVALEMLHREFAEPLSGEFRRAFDEQNLGLPLEVALEKLSKRVPLLDVHFFVSAVLLQRRTGGNLAELLDKLAALIRERFKLRGRIRAISAHGRMTGTVLSSIPAGVAAIMFYVNPDYVMFFVTDETGQIMMAAAVVLQLIGYGVIRKIVSIEI